MCFGIDLSGLISKEGDVRRGEEWQGRERKKESVKPGVREKMRPKDEEIIFVKVRINERLVYHKLINFTKKCFRD